MGVSDAVLARLRPERWDLLLSRRQDLAESVAHICATVKAVQELVTGLLKGAPHVPLVSHLVLAAGPELLDGLGLGEVRRGEDELEGSIGGTILALQRGLQNDLKLQLVEVRSSDSFTLFSTPFFP